MSTVFFQIGQCGNQLGQAFNDYMLKEMNNASPAHQAICASNFFLESEKSSKLTSKALLIDMESKVVNSCLQHNKNGGDWIYDNKYAFFKQEGSGNNWAYGYNIHGPSCEEQIFEKLDSLLEKIDVIDGFVFLQSLAGGTGSGLGSFLLERVKERYGKNIVLSIAVLPHLTGEVILQSYNFVLSLSTIYKNADGLILFENDDIQFICSKLLNLKNAELEDMNKVISQQIGSIFFPVLNQKTKNVFSSLQTEFNFFDDGVNLLLNNPLYKLLKVHHVPQMSEFSKEFSNDSWNSLEKRIFQMLLSNSTEANINWNLGVDSKNLNKSYANLLIARGNDTKDYDFNLSNNKEIYSNKNIKYKFFIDCHNFSKNEKSVSYISNSQNFINSFEILTDRSNQMFKEKAYLYQYEKYNLEEKEFLENILSAEQILSNYQRL